MAHGGGCAGGGGCLLSGGSRLSSFDHPITPEAENRNIRELIYHVCFSLQGPPGQPGYPGAMGPPGLPVSKGTLALVYQSLGVAVRTGLGLGIPWQASSFLSISAHASVRPSMRSPYCKSPWYCGLAPVL